MQKSFAIVLRVFDGEAPYLQSFIDHHRSIGIDRFYVLLSPGESPLCREILEKNKISFFDVQGQRVERIWRQVKEDYVSVLDADEYLHPEVVRFASEEAFRSLQMPWRMTATLDDNGFTDAEKHFFVFPQVKSMMRTKSLTSMSLHLSGTKGEGERLGLDVGLRFPLNHYYLRGIDDLLLKEGGVVALTGATTVGRTPVSLEGDVQADSPQFPSRHAKAAFVLKMLEVCPKVNDPYHLKIDPEMLARVLGTAQFDLREAKDRLRQSIKSIVDVFSDKTIKRQHRNIERIFSDNPRRVNFQKKVIKALQKDYSKRKKGMGSES